MFPVCDDSRTKPEKTRENPQRVSINNSFIKQYEWEKN